MACVGSHTASKGVGCQTLRLSIWVLPYCQPHRCFSSLWIVIQSLWPLAIPQTPFRANPIVIPQSLFPHTRYCLVCRNRGRSLPSPFRRLVVFLFLSLSSALGVIVQHTGQRVPCGGFPLVLPRYLSIKRLAASSLNVTLDSSHFFFSLVNCTFINPNLWAW